MPLPIAGVVQVEVVRAMPVAIHGDLYLDLECRPDGAAGIEALRIPAHLMPREPDAKAVVPQAGDRLELNILLGQVDSVRRPGS